MARGWESKSVESQIESADSKSDRAERLTPEQRRLRQKRESIELSRRRVLQEIETTRSPVRRASLEQALAFLDKELEGAGGGIVGPSPVEKRKARTNTD